MTMMIAKVVDVDLVRFTCSFIPSMFYLFIRISSGGGGGGFRNRDNDENGEGGGRRFGG